VSAHLTMRSSAPTTNAGKNGPKVMDKLTAARRPR
jgi:hypothetical protein